MRSAGSARRADLGHLWMVANPPQHPGGDFGIAAGRATTGDGPRFTWSGIGAFRAGFVDALMGDFAAGETARMRPYLDAAIAQGRLGAELWAGPWADVGTPARLAALQAANPERSGPATLSRPFGIPFRPLVHRLDAERRRVAFFASHIWLWCRLWMPSPWC